MNTRRQAERRLGLLLVEEMACRERRAEPESSSGEQHVLDRWINACAGPAVGTLGAMLKTGHDPNWCLVEMLGEVLRGSGLPPIALGIHPRWRRARAIMRPDHLVVGALIPNLHRLLYGPVLNHEEAPLLGVRAIGRALPRLENSTDERVRHRIRFKPPHRSRRLDDLEQFGVAGHG